MLGGAAIRNTEFHTGIQEQDNSKPSSNENFL